VAPVDLTANLTMPSWTVRTMPTTCSANVTWGTAFSASDAYMTSLSCGTASRTLIGMSSMNRYMNVDLAATQAASSTTTWYSAWTGETNADFITNRARWRVDWNAPVITTNGTAFTLSLTTFWDDYAPSLSLRDRLQAAIRRRLGPAIHTGRKSLLSPEDERERRARETLRRVIGDGAYRDFLSKGFVSVQARSGRVYQIFPGHGITSVFERGQLVGRFCVVLDGQFPPTDSVIMRYLLILNDERHFESLAVKHELVGAVRPAAELPGPDRPLVEVFREIKAGRGGFVAPPVRPMRKAV